MAELWPDDITKWQVSITFLVFGIELNIYFFIIVVLAVVVVKLSVAQ